MWLFTRYGFYSIACANKPGGSVDTETVGPCPTHRPSSKSAEALPCPRRWRDSDLAEAGLSLSADCPENVLGRYHRRTGPGTRMVEF
jgi:hypothetical protein